MLAKTLELISRFAPGTYVEDPKECFDPDELEKFGRILSALVYSPSRLRSELQEKYGVTITRSDFYSEIPTILELENSFSGRSLLDLGTLFPSNDRMLAELDRLKTYASEFTAPVEKVGPGIYSWKGVAFSYSDAMAYYTMIRSRKPRNIVEIGSGWSTIVARKACEKNGFGNITCIEPYPMDFLLEMPGVTVLKLRAQNFEEEQINSMITDGDMLFIDSTHTVKHDSDCLHIYLRLLPSIKSDITVHVHDIYFPRPLPISMMRDRQIFWNEQYLLYAYLTSNHRTKVLYGSAYHTDKNPELLKDFMCDQFEPGGASFWFEQAK